MSTRRGVIVEGPDCSGKTQFIASLKGAFPGNWDVRHMAHQAGDQFKRYSKVYLEADRLLLDRAHFSEQVYGDLFRHSKHFAPWELEILNRIAREEFVTVLCTAPAEALVLRHGKRDFPQPPTTLDQTIAVRARFHAVVEPHATFVVDSDFSIGKQGVERLFAEMVARIGALVQAEPAGRRPVSVETPHALDFVVVEGGEDSGRSDVVRLLEARLPGWCVVRFDPAADRDPFRAFMRQYSAARRTIFDGGHLTYAATAPAGDENGGAFRDVLDDYAASRGRLIACERSKDDAVSRRIRAMAQRYGDRCRPVRTDDPNSLAELAAIMRPAVASAQAS